MSKPIRLLIVEDHIALADNLFEFLSSDNFVLDFAADGYTALRLASVNKYDVLVLDIMLPGLSGLELCRSIRTGLCLATPILMMTAKDQIGDKAAGFGSGADDYLVKPFDLHELKLRVEALHRRSRPKDMERIKVGSLCFDAGTLQISMEGKPELELTGSGARIFEALARKYPNMLPHDELHWLLWGERAAEMHTLRTHVYKLRKQLQDFFGISLIKTIRGRGYRLVPPEER